MHGNLKHSKEKHSTEIKTFKLSLLLSFGIRGTECGGEYNTVYLSL